MLIYNCCAFMAAIRPVHRWPEGCARYVQTFSGAESAGKHQPHFEASGQSAWTAIFRHRPCWTKGRKAGAASTTVSQFDTYPPSCSLTAFPRQIWTPTVMSRFLNLLGMTWLTIPSSASPLQTYLEQAKSLSKTADLLFIHRNTVRYRINRCMELMNDRLEGRQRNFCVYSLPCAHWNTAPKYIPCCRRNSFSEQNR